MSGPFSPQDTRAAWLAAAQSSRDGGGPLGEWVARQDPLCPHIKRNALLGMEDRLIAWQAQVGRARLEVLNVSDTDAPRKAWLLEQIELQRAEIQGRIVLIENVRTHGMPLWLGGTE